MEILDIKHSVEQTLQNSFIENASSVRKEMELLNILIQSFSGEAYVYDEYCSKRMEFELLACDSVDVETYKHVKVNQLDGILAQNKISNMLLSNPNLDAEKAYENELVEISVNKLHKVETQTYFTISNLSSIDLLKNKIPNNIWQEKEEYFLKICKNKALKQGKACADMNRASNAQDIRTSLI